MIPVSRLFRFGLFALAGVLAFLSTPLAAAASADSAPPNFIIILADDLGYGDLGCYGQKKIRTPNIDRMAREGMRFTDFYVAAPVCSPSRAALMTGCYPPRVGLGVCSRERDGEVVPWHVLYPNSRQGLHQDELTLPELLKERGYATACIGKWHLGEHPQFLPTSHGFDYYYGIPYSNDMKPTVMMRGEEVVEPEVDQATITRKYTEEAVRYIAEKKDGPFFLYLAHNAPHTPLHASEQFRGKSPRGLYGDVVEELDWSVGEVLRAIDQAGIAERTLVVFLSDNGPWLRRGENGGIATPLRNGKGSTYEGGMRVPFIARWKGTVPAGTVCSEIATAMDLLPTFVRLAGGEPPADRRIDGREITALLRGEPGARSPHEAIYYYFMDDLQAVRSGPWKLKLETTVARDDHYTHVGDPNSTVPAALYNLEDDPGEQKSVLNHHPRIVERLEALAARAREDLGDAYLGVTGRNRRPAGFLDVAPPAASTSSAAKR